MEKVIVDPDLAVDFQGLEIKNLKRRNLKLTFYEQENVSLRQRV